MEANAWWLLAIPLFFGLGWLAARLDAAQLLTQTRALPTSYFKGLNYLLAEQHDKAIVAFEEVARLDPETAELYFALGQLFRRRGEPDRAIRIHKNLLQRADLPAAQREQALFELAQDFLVAGIFDHAENAFGQLVGTRYAAQAQRELARLYEKEANWEAAIRCAQAYLQSQPTPTDSGRVLEDLAHYACEQAALELAAQRWEQAQTALNQARQFDATNPRIVFLQAQIHFALGQIEHALNILDQTVSNHSKQCALAVNTALAGLGTSPKPEHLDQVLNWAIQHPSALAVQALGPILRAAGRDHDVQRLLTVLATQLNVEPQAGTMSAIRSLWTAVQANPLSPEQNSLQSAAVKASDALSFRYDRPQCTVCGFKASRHHWRCPGCGNWNTLPFTL